jgi:hypothetical protein
MWVQSDFIFCCRLLACRLTGDRTVLTTTCPHCRCLQLMKTTLFEFDMVSIPAAAERADVVSQHSQLALHTQCTAVCLHANPDGRQLLHMDLPPDITPCNITVPVLYGVRVIPLGCEALYTGFNVAEFAVTTALRQKEVLCCIYACRYTTYLWASTAQNLSEGQTEHNNQTVLIPPAYVDKETLPLPTMGVMLLMGDGTSPSILDTSVMQIIWQQNTICNGNAVVGAGNGYMHATAHWCETSQWCSVTSYVFCVCRASSRTCCPRWGVPSAAPGQGRCTPTPLCE